MTRDEIRKALRTFILTNFLHGEPPESLTDSTSLVSSGLVTSLAMVELSTFIEDEFSMTLQPEDLRVSRMDTIDLLVELVMRRAGTPAESTGTSG